MTTLYPFEDCETAYVTCFATADETVERIRFRDAAIPDMYNLNHSFVKPHEGVEALAACINGEIAHNRSEGMHFCNILMDGPMPDGLAELLGMPATVTGYRYFVLTPETHHPLHGSPEGHIARIDSPAMVDDCASVIVTQYGKLWGEDFCRRKALRTGEVFMRDGGVDSYLCYAGETPVGNCELFVHGGIAKIEDFDVLEAFQRKGYGTTLIQTLIETAWRRGCKTAYLLTESDNTAQYLYRKLGFTDAGERTQLFFDLKEAPLQ